MRKVVYLIGFFCLLTFPVSASANSVVNISNNGSGSTNNVNVQTNQSSSNGDTTDITIESNGVTKTYHGTGNQSVHMESSDGHSQVTVNNQSSSSNGVSQNSSNSSQSFSDPLSTPAVEGTSSAQVKNTSEITSHSFDLMTFFKTEFSVITTFFSSLFH